MSKLEMQCLAIVVAACLAFRASWMIADVRRQKVHSLYTNHCQQAYSTPADQLIRRAYLDLLVFDQADPVSPRGPSRAHRSHNLHANASVSFLLHSAVPEAEGGPARHRQNKQSLVLRVTWQHRLTSALPERPLTNESISVFKYEKSPPLLLFVLLLTWPDWSTRASCPGALHALNLLRLMDSPDRRPWIIAPGFLCAFCHFGRCNR